MTASEWDWTLRVFHHVQLNASDYTASVRFYETVLSPLGIPKIAESETLATVKVRRCTDHL